MSRGVRSMNGINNIEVNNIEFPDGSTISSASSLVQLDTNNNFTGNNTFNVNLPTSTKTPLIGDINNNTMLNKASADLLYSQTDENDYPTAFTRNGTTGVITLTTADTGTPLSGDTTFTSITDAQILAIGDNTTAIATNTTAIGDIRTDIATNTTAIGNNTTDIATNTTAIGNNTTDIATNTTNIGTTNEKTDINTENISTINTAITRIDASLSSLQTQINNIITFNPNDSYTFAGNNTFTGDNNFTGDNTFTNALMTGVVVQTKYHHEKAQIFTTQTGGSNTDFYTRLEMSPTNFFVSLTPKSLKSYIRVSVVAHYSLTNTQTQNDWWSAVRLFRNGNELTDANNTRGGVIGTPTSIGECWIMNTAGQYTADFNVNFVRQISGTYLDTDDNKWDENGNVRYSIAIRGNIFGIAPSTNQQKLCLNGSFSGQITGNNQRPVATSYIQLEEIYIPPT